MVAKAVQVTMFVTPGPMEKAHAKVCMRFLILL
jgi:hypothetical protein